MTMTIGVLAEEAGVGVETVRFYQRRGLMPEPPRPPRGVRRYEDADLARLRFIRSAQASGFALRDVAELLRLQDGSHCDEARVLAESKLVDVRERLRELGRIERVLDDLVARCRGAAGRVACPLIETLRE